MNFPIYTQPARSILSPTSGFIREVGFTHSLTPARNCTFGCSYCYVPTMNVYGGLKREDWEHWGQFTTFKENAAALLQRELREDQVIYCSPLVDPYQPVEEQGCAMPPILNEIIRRPPARFVIQTRGPLVVRDLPLFQQIPRLRVSVSVTTNREEVRRHYEPRCATLAERLKTIRTLNEAGIPAYAALAPILPCDPEELIDRVVEATPFDLIGDPFHMRHSKRRGATTRDAAVRIAAKHQESDWLDEQFQEALVDSLKARAAYHGRHFEIGPPGFALLTRDAG